MVRIGIVFWNARSRQHTCDSILLVVVARARGKAWVWTACVGARNVLEKHWWQDMLWLACFAEALAQLYYFRSWKHALPHIAVVQLFFLFGIAERMCVVGWRFGQHVHSKSRFVRHQAQHILQLL
jgi:hypothetical protein